MFLCHLFAVTMYAWSAVSDFTQLVEEVSCRGLAFKGVSTKRLEAQDAAAAGLLDVTNWWAIIASSHNFSGDAEVGLVKCAIRGSRRRNRDLVVPISNFPPITRTDELSLSMGSVKQLVRSVEGNSVELLLRVISPPMGWKREDFTPWSRLW